MDDHHHERSSNNGNHYSSINQNGRHHADDEYESQNASFATHHINANKSPASPTSPTSPTSPVSDGEAEFVARKNMPTFPYTKQRMWQVLLLFFPPISIHRHDHMWDCLR
jgi:hypothetical protein